MTMLTLLLAMYSPLFLPLIFPFLGDTAAHILRQAHWSDPAKETTAWAVLVISAVIEAIVSGKWSDNPNLLLPVLSGTATLLLAGPLTQLSPWLVGMAWVEKTFFNLPSSSPGTIAALTQITAVTETGTAKGPNKPVGKGQPAPVVITFPETPAKSLSGQATTPLAVVKPPPPPENAG